MWSTPQGRWSRNHGTMWRRLCSTRMRRSRTLARSRRRVREPSRRSSRSRSARPNPVRFSAAAVAPPLPRQRRARWRSAACAGAASSRGPRVAPAHIARAHGSCRSSLPKRLASPASRPASLAAGCARSAALVTSQAMVATMCPCRALGLARSQQTAVAGSLAAQIPVEANRPCSACRASVSAKPGFARLMARSASSLEVRRGAR
mmetsp:Transcript_46297/g.128802  ORF Transcript_46297/g.128802 Transcript_46297/m.128802 type:complete len:205 (+) Transcript_46297:266-880(+)